MSATRVLHIIDSLAVGGAEQMAINAVNYLPRDRFQPFLCTSREEGPLASQVRDDVTWIKLGRRHRYDLSAIARLARFIHGNGIRIVHAHSTAVFLGLVSARLNPGTLLCWHTHGGLDKKAHGLYGFAARRADGVIAVSQPLVEWVVRNLGVSKERVWYVPNFISPAPVTATLSDLPGVPGRRMVCVVNFRPEKDHFNVLKAMSIVVERVPDAHLFFVGEPRGDEYTTRVLEAAKPLSNNVSFLGRRLDVSNILHSCDVGVLGSQYEGLPLALIEYGFAALPVVVTATGQNSEVVDNGNAGLLVSTQDPEGLASGMITLLEDEEQRTRLGRRLAARVQSVYSQQVVIRRLCDAYDSILERASRC